MDSKQIAVIVGANGGIGSALRDAAQRSGSFGGVHGYGRTTNPDLDVTDEASIARSAAHAAALGDITLLAVTTGFLHDGSLGPEKALRQVTPEGMAKAFAINTIGPALVLKHFLPLLPRDRRSVAAVLSAKVGSIGDNHLGGWHSYRASKAAVNQIVRTAAIELRRTHPQAILVSVHPGTVDTKLSAPFSRTGLEVQTPERAASDILTGLESLDPEMSGRFIDRFGDPLPF